MACLRSAVPPTGVYLVKPSCSALTAASLICSGVSKSGSPAPRPIISFPSARNLTARAVTASVGEGLMVAARSAIFISNSVSSGTNEKRACNILDLLTALNTLWQKNFNLKQITNQPAINLTPSDVCLKV